MIKATGELQIVLKDANGNVKQDVTVPNLVVTIGKTVIASRLAGLAGMISPMSHMAIGVSSANLVAANTALADEEARVALDSTSAANNVVTYSATFPAGTGTGAIVEAGIFNNDGTPNGDMLCRTTFSVVNKDAADTLTINWNVTIN